MKIVYNRFFPICCKCMTLWPWFFTKSENLTRVDLNHEGIHAEQQKELLVVGFLVLYALSYVYEVVKCSFDRQRGYKKGVLNNGVLKRAYRNIIFEREAYANEKDSGYLDDRRHYAWIKS